MINSGKYEENFSDVTASMVKILARQKKRLQICHINAQSLKPKIDELRWIFENSTIDIICVSETWLDGTTPDGIISLSGYKIFRSDRLVVVVVTVRLDSGVPL